MEVLRARVPEAAAGQRSHDSAGRNPRALRLSEVTVRGDAIALDFSVHDRWEIPRELLMEEAPATRLPGRKRRLMAEWLAKRYIRAAFPTAFDARWRGESRAWRKLLKRHSYWIQGVYLRLDTQDEIAVGVPYRCDLLLAMPVRRRNSPTPATPPGFERCGGCSGSPGSRRPIRSSLDSSGPHWSPVTGLSSMSWSRR